MVGLEAAKSNAKPIFSMSGAKKKAPRLVKLFSASLMMGLYILWAVMFYGSTEGWSTVDCIYFAAVTMSTVGYGDLSPSDNDLSMWVTVFFIFFGIIFVFAEVSSCVTSLVSPVFRAGRDIMDRWFPMKTVDIDGDGKEDIKIPRGPLIYYTKNLLSNFVVIIFGQNPWAVGYWQLEGWRYTRAWYHCMTTFTTVGYGDVSIVTDPGKIFACFHLLISVSLLAQLISDISSLMAQRATQLKRAEMLAKRLDPELIKSLDKDGAGVDKTEFVVGMLVKLELITEADVEPYLKQFAQLDADGSGILTKDDLEAASRSMAEGKTPSATPAPTPTRRPKDMVRLEVPVRRSDQGSLGISISARNVIDDVHAAGTAQGSLKFGDVVVAVDGVPLQSTSGTLMQLKDLFRELPKRNIHRFLVERSGVTGRFDPALSRGTPAIHGPGYGGAIVPAPAASVSPGFSPYTPSPSKKWTINGSSEGPVDVSAVAYAWGAMGLPREQMNQFIELIGSGDMPSLQVRAGFDAPTPRLEATLESPIKQVV